MAEELLTVEEVAARLRSNPETVRRYLRAGKLRGVRPGGTRLGWRIPSSELDRFLASSAASAAAEAADDTVRS